MAGQQWCININPGSPNTFVPDVYHDPDTEPSESLVASTGDVVSWSNQTEEPHDLSITDANFENPGASITKAIEPWKPSLNAYVTATADASPTPPATVEFPVTIYYACTVHPGEHGTIELIA
ncbi:MAG TPA: hypothetical protein VF618_08905 [Thermoanaerobaculia bacterium]